MLFDSNSSLINKKGIILLNIFYCFYIIYLKAMYQPIPQRHEKLRSLLDRVFATSNLAVAVTATHVLMNVLPRQGNLLKPRDRRSHRFCLVPIHAILEVVVPLHYVLNVVFCKVFNQQQESKIDNNKDDDNNNKQIKMNNTFKLSKIGLSN